MSLTRRILGSTALIAAAAIAARVMGFVSSPILTRRLGPEAYGDFALVATAVSLATTIALLGIDMGYARYFFGPKDASGLVQRFCWRFAMRNAAVVAILVMAWWMLVVHTSDSRRSFGIVVGLTVVLSASSTMAQTRARLEGRYARLAVALLASGLLATGASIGLSFMWPRTAWPLLAGMLVSPVALWLLNGGTPRSVFTQNGALGDAKRREIVRLGLAGAITAPAQWVLFSADRWFLEHFRSVETVGVYSFVASIATSGIVLNGALVATWYPEAARLYSEAPVRAQRELGRLWGRLVVILAVAWLAFAAAAGDVVRLIGAPPFHSGAHYAPLLSATVFFLGIASVANTGLFLKGTMGPVALFWIAGAAVGLGANVFLVPAIGPAGAALSGCLGLASIGAVSMWASQRAVRLDISWRRLTLVVSCTAISGWALAPPWFERAGVSLAVKFPVGVALALAALRVEAPEWFDRLVAAARARLFPLDRP